MNEFSEELKIDPNELDVEAGLQAEKFFQWAERAAEARAEYDRAKLNFEVTEAKLSSKARANPTAYGISKRVTEGSISTAVRLHPKYLAAYEGLVEARKSMELLNKAVMAMEQRKRMIELLVTLHGQQYFAGPSVPRNLGEAWQDAVERRSKGVVGKQVKRKRTTREKVGRR